MRNDKRDARKITIIFLLLLLIIFFISLFLFFHEQKNKQIPKVFIQKPVNKVKLPSGSKMNIPNGFTVFKSKINGVVNYSFIKYVPKWKNNNFVKIDLIIIKKKYLDISAEKFGKSDFDEAIIKPKINLSNELKKLREKFNEDGQKYDIDYSQFKAQYSINGKINNRIWRRYALQLYEVRDEGKTSFIKIWNNLYTIYKDYVYIFDYVCDMGIRIKNDKYTDGYSESANGIDKMAQEIISSIEFK